MIKNIVKCKNPEILVITPLRYGDKVSKDTKKSIKRNRTPFVWISYMGDNNPAKNVAVAYKQYRKDNGGLPPYVIKIDNDLTASRYMLDKMYNVLSSSDRTKDVAYTYCSFSFTGHMNISFRPTDFDENRLMKNNYISSCSLIDTKLLDSIGGWVTDDKYFRLLDWCLWLRFLKRGYIGKLTKDVNFTAFSTPNSVSCRSREDFTQKYRLVLKDFVNPINQNI